MPPPSFPRPTIVGARDTHGLARGQVSAKNLGDEGGYAPSLEDPDETLRLIEEAIRAAGYGVGEDVFLALDCASSEFHKDGKYEIKAGKVCLGPAGGLAASDCLMWLVSLSGTRARRPSSSTCS